MPFLGEKSPLKRVFLIIKRAEGGDFFSGCKLEGKRVWSLDFLNVFFEGSSGSVLEGGL